MSLQHGYLALDADLGNGEKTGVFELVGNLEVKQNLKINHLFGNELGNINAVTTSLPGWVEGSLDQGESSRVSYFLDLGDGRNTFTINAMGWNPEEDNYLWGAPDAPSGSIYNATSEGMMAQMATLFEYLQQGEYDSRDESARLYFGEYYPDLAERPDWMPTEPPDTPFDDYKHLTVQRGTVNRNANNPKAMDVSIVVQETQDMTAPIDVATQVEF